MKMKLIIAILLVMALCVGCEFGVADEPIAGASAQLSEAQMNMLGMTQEEFDNLSEEEKAAMQDVLNEIDAVIQAEQEAAEQETAEQPADETEAPAAEIDPEAEVQPYLEQLPLIPAGAPEYGYEWSDRMERITYYLITIDPANVDDVNNFLYLLEAEYGYMSDGKEIWDEATDTTTYGYSTDTSRIYVDVIPNPDGTVKVVIYISYNPFL